MIITEKYLISRDICNRNTWIHKLYNRGDILTTIGIHDYGNGFSKYILGSKEEFYTEMLNSGDNTVYEKFITKKEYDRGKG